MSGGSSPRWDSPRFLKAVFDRAQSEWLRETKEAHESFCPCGNWRGHLEEAIGVPTRTSRRRLSLSSGVGTHSSATSSWSRRGSEGTDSESSGGGRSSAGGGTSIALGPATGGSAAGGTSETPEDPWERYLLEGESGEPSPYPVDVESKCLCCPRFPGRWSNRWKFLPSCRCVFAVAGVAAGDTQVVRVGGRGGPGDMAVVVGAGIVAGRGPPGGGPASGDLTRSKAGTLPGFKLSLVPSGSPSTPS